MKITSKNLLLNSIGILCLCAASCACSKNGGEEEKTSGNVKPKYSKSTVLRNPLNGWVMYSSGNYTPAYWDTEQFVPDLAKKVRMSDYASAGYLRTKWSVLNPEEGVYAWRDPNTVVAKVINGAIERGLPIALRIVVDGADQGLNTPQFVFDKGAEYEPGPAGYPDRKRPYPQHPVFQAEYAKFITELAKDFNDPKKCAFIDAYGLGKWGEAHGVVYGTSDRTEIEALKYSVLDWITDLYSKNFTNVPLVINYHRVVCDPNSDGSANPNSEKLLELAINRGYSLRSDAFGMTASSYGYSTWEKNFAAKWNYSRPIIMEGGWITGGTHQYWTDPSGKYIEGKPGTVRQGEYDQSKESKVNMMDFRVGNDGATWFTDAFSLVKSFVSEGGYRLYPDQLSLPETMSANSAVKVMHRWRNMGWGYFPNNIPQWNYRYKPALALLDVTGNVKAVFVDKDAEPSSWVIQNKPYPYEFTVNANVPAGRYIWAVAIVDTKDDNKPAIQLPLNEDKTDEGWYTLLTVEVK